MTIIGKPWSSQKVVIVMLTLREYAIKDGTDTQKFSPRVFRAYRAIQGLEDEGDNTGAGLAISVINVHIAE